MVEFLRSIIEFISKNLGGVAYLIVVITMASATLVFALEVVISLL